MFRVDEIAGEESLEADVVEVGVAGAACWLEGGVVRTTGTRERNGRIDIKHTGHGSKQMHWEKQWHHTLEEGRNRSVPFATCHVIRRLTILSDISSDIETNCVE